MAARFVCRQGSAEVSCTSFGISRPKICARSISRERRGPCPSKHDFRDRTMSWNMREKDAVQRLTKAVERVTASATHTPDLGGKATTREVTDAVCDAMHNANVCASRSRQ